MTICTVHPASPLSHRPDPLGVLSRRRRQKRGVGSSSGQPLISSLSFCKSVLWPDRCLWPCCHNDRWRLHCGLDVPSALGLRLQAPFGPPFFRPSIPTPVYSPPQKKDQPLNGPAPKSERWQFLMLLPSQLIRDVAFVVASPSTFSNSHELPLVSKNMFGEDDSWQIAEDWLKGLDSQEVLRYFEGRRYTTRLGDHFAACIEYVLKSSPLVLPDPLFISQQVGGWTIPNQQSSRTLKKAKGEFGSFALEKGAMMSDVIVKLIENDVLIKRISNYQISRRGRVKQVPDSDIECLMDQFKKSSFDYHSATEMQETVCSEECHEEDLSLSIHANAVLESMWGLPELLGIAKGIQKWRVCYSVDLNQKEELTGNKVVANHMVPVKSTAVNGSKSESTKRASMNSKPANHVLSDKAISNVENSSPQADGNMHLSQTFTNTFKHNPIKKSATKRKLSYLQRVGPAPRPKTQIEMEKGETAGECDFLFKANAKHLMQESSDYAWTHIHHWEVSVHFFLYVGPWESFGLVTPGSSMWHHCGKKSSFYSGGA